MERSKNDETLLLHSLVGLQSPNFSSIMYKNKRLWRPSEKFVNFYKDGDSTEAVEENLGLDIREVICCASKISPAVTYHKPYGLILSGQIKSIFDNDSGTSLDLNGNYQTTPRFNFTNEVNLQTLMSTWYDEFSSAKRFTWNEIILKKGSRIVGAFHDPNFNRDKLNHRAYCTYGSKEYPKFLEKAKRLGLDLIEIDAKFK